MFESFRKGLALRALDGEISKLADQARAYESNGAAPGSEVYRKLYESAIKKIDEATVQYGLEDVSSRYPVLLTMKKLTVPVEETSLAGRVAAGAVGVVLLAYCSGFLIGMFQLGVHTLVK